MALSFVVEDGVMEQAEVKFREEVYKKLWTIPDWERIQRSRESVEAETIEFTTGKSARVQSKWKLGFKIKRKQRGTATRIHLYWKLTEAQGFPDGKVQVTAVSTLMSDGWGSWINPAGELVYKLKLEIMKPEPTFDDLEMEEFQKANSALVLANLGSLLGDEATADLKIVTSDAKELLAHKAILKVQCPVFESMFRSDMSENSTGVVNVKDVNAKTMGIILHLLYTGELLPSWKDDDTVVGFTYAVGKYQLANVLKLVDKTLGRLNDEDTFQRDIQLLDLAKKLELKTAEKDLLARIKKTLFKVDSATEFFDLFEW